MLRAQPLDRLRIVTPTRAGIRPARSSAAVDQFGTHDAPTLEDIRAGRAWNTYPGESFTESNHWSWQSIVRRAAADLSG